MAAKIEHMFATRVNESAALPWEISWQASLFGLDPATLDPTFAGLERHLLDDTSWVEHLPRWLGGSDQVFAELVARTPWRQRRVPMYERMVDEPRLTWWWTEADGRAALPLPVLAEVLDVVAVRYDRPFDSIGLNFYRDGRDSVAWHGDRVRHQQAD